MTAEQTPRKGIITRTADTISAVARSRITAFLLGAAAMVPLAVKTDSTQPSPNVKKDKIEISYAGHPLFNAEKVTDTTDGMKRQARVGKLSAGYEQKDNVFNLSAGYDDKALVALRNGADSKKSWHTLIFGQEDTSLTVQLPRKVAEQPKEVTQPEIKNDTRDGNWTTLDNAGNATQTAMYKQGVENGAVVTYREDGSVAQTGFMKDGKRIGIWVTRDQAGQVTSREGYNRYGERTFKVDFSEKGPITKKTLYLKGEVDSYIIYDDNGQEIDRYGNASYHMDRFLMGNERECLRAMRGLLDEKEMPRSIFEGRKVPLNNPPPATNYLERE